MPSMTRDLGDSAMSDRSLPTIDNYAYNDESTTSRQSDRLDEEAGLDMDEGKRADEPYAQLIFRAFMSRENHAMTLQEIYQWFRENTDKATPEGKGWQNSIRHNLSMNAAFIKPDNKATPNGFETDAETSKGSTEWVLEDWAVREGVQSTTSYRSKNNTSQKATNSHRSGRLHHPPARAMLDRKGGSTTSNTRIAANRAAVGRQKQSSGIPGSRNPRDRFPTQQTSYNPAASMNFRQASGNEPVTSVGMAGGETILANNTMRSPLSMGSFVGHEYYFWGQHAQLQPPVPYSYPLADLYRLEDAVHVYEVPSLQSMVSDSIEALYWTQQPASFGELVTDVGGSAQGSDISNSNMSYGSVDSSRFHE